MENLTFDANVALLGYSAEAEAGSSQRKKDGAITSRWDAQSVMLEASRDVSEMERAAKKRK